MPTSRILQDSVDNHVPSQTSQPDFHKRRLQSSPNARHGTSSGEDNEGRSTKILPRKLTRDGSSAPRQHLPSPTSNPRAISQDGLPGLQYYDARTPSQSVSPSPNARPISGLSSSPSGLRTHHHNHSLSSYGSSPGSPNHLAHAQILPRSPPFGHQLPTSPRGRIAGMRRPSGDVSTAFPYAPPPHHPQTHFHGLLDPDLGMSDRRGGNVKPGDKQYFCGFDTLQSAGDDSCGTENVILIGYDGGLDIYRADSAELDMIASVNGIHGAVIDAKILPCSSRVEAESASLPHIALLVHGSVNNAMSGTDPTYKHQFSTFADNVEQPLAYATRLEVFSLRSREHVASLFQTQPRSTPHNQSVADVHQLAAADGLSLDASGRFVLIASDQSGEVFIFSRLPVNGQGNTFPYHCIGKFWTSVLLRSSDTNVRPASDHKRPKHNPSERSETRNPIFSLSARWLAIVPPTSPFSSTINGFPSVGDDSPKPMGLDSVTSPLPPQPNCILDMPQDDTMVSKLARSAAQEFLKGAKWASNQGVQTIRSYWRTSSPAIEDHNTLATYPAGLDLPPTHAAAQIHSSTSTETALVSVIDLESLLDGSKMKRQQSQPSTWTFPVPLGCDFVSFSPNGLNLLTVSRSGHVQFIWDMKGLRLNRTVPKSTDRQRFEHGRGGSTTSDNHVRQVAKFSRMTETTIADIVWSEPLGTRVAVITDKGTVHVFELSSNALRWPHAPFAGHAGGSMNSKVGTTTLNEAIETDERPTVVSSPWNYVSSTVSSINGRARPIISALRGHGLSSSPITLSNLGNLTLATAGTGVKNSKAMALGVTKSIGAVAGSMNKQIRKGGEILRIRMPLGSGKVNKRCVRFMTGKDRGLIATVSDAVVRMHSIRPANNASTSNLSSNTKDIEFMLPDLPEISTHPKLPIGDEDQMLKLKGFYRPPRYPPRTDDVSVTNYTTSEYVHPLSFAELESSAPFQPFHTDHRVTLSTYQEPEPWDVDSDLMYGPDITEGDPWCFGAEIKSKTVCSGGVDRKHEGESVTRSKAMQTTDAMRLGNDDEVIVTTLKSTKRKSNRKLTDEDGKEERNDSVGDDIDEFFEDDCEVLDFR